jgi:hypothetical protein
MRYPVPDDAVAPCAADPDLFFSPNRKETPQEQKERVEAAKAICADCPFQQPCMEYALRYRVEGIWAGVGGKQRRTIQRKQGIEPEPVMVLARCLTYAGQPPHGTLARTRAHYRAGETPCVECREADRRRHRPENPGKQRAS